MTDEVPKEDTLLLPISQEDEARPRGQATVGATVVNLMKTCMGTGTLALPFAAQQGGLFLNSVGLFGIAVWNLYSVDRLCRSIEYLESHEDLTTANLPRFVSSTFGKVAWFAFGEKGVHGLDGVLVLLFLGIIVAYDGEFRCFFFCTFS